MHSRLLPNNAMHTDVVAAPVSGPQVSAEYRLTRRARSLLRTSALSTIAFALSGMAAFAEEGGLWQSQVRAIVGANNDGATAALEGFVPLKQTAESVLFLDVRAKHDFEDGFGQDFGIGIRRIVNPDLMLGGYAYINTQRQDGHQFTGATLGLEAITTNFDAHVNVFLPISGDRAEQSTNSSLSMVGNQLLEQISVIDRRNYAAWGIEGEIGAQVPVALPENHALRLSIGAYHFGDPDGDDDSITGGKAGFEYQIGDVFGSGSSLAFAGEVRNDNRDDTQFAGSVRLTIPFNRGGEAQGDAEGPEPVYAVSEGLRKRVNERVRGDIGVRIEGNEKLVSSSTRVAINAVTGTAFGKFFFADGANTLGLGTLGDPTTLDDAVTNAGANGFVVALGGSGNLLTAGVTLANGQTVIGGGESVTAQLFGGGTGSYNLGGSNGTIAGTNPANNVITLGNGNTLRGITITGGADGIFGNNVNGATLTSVTVSGAGGHGASFTGTSTGIKGSNFTSTGNGLDGLHIVGNGTYNFTGTTLLQDNGDDGLDIAGQGTYTFAILNAQDNTDAGIYVAGTSVSGSFATTGGTVSGNGGIAVFIDPITANVTLNSISHSGGTSGVVLDNLAGSFTVTGQTTISNTSGPAIDIVNSPASIRFGDINITNPGGDGISFAGVNATVVAGNIVISGLGVGTGLDFSGSRTNFTAQSVNITGTGAGSIGIDLAQTVGGSTIVISNGGVIANVGTGVRLGISGSLVNSANAQFTFGGGSISGVTASLDARGLNQTLGTYAFGSTSLVGPQLFDAQNLIFVGASATGSGTGSSLLDLASIATADANTDGTAIFVLVNRGTDIDDTDGFSLSAGQTLASFGNGRQFSLGGVPINVTGTNVQHSTTISDAGGAATLTNTGIGETVILADNTSLLNFNLSNDGGGSGVFGSGVSNVTLTGLTVSGADLNGVLFAGTNSVSGSNLTSSNNGGTGLAIVGGGTYAFTGTTALTDNGGSGLAISSGTGSYSFDTLNVTGNGGNGVSASGTSAGELSIANGTISGNGLTGFLASGIGLDVTLASLSQTGGSTGISLAGVSGDFTVSGTTTISNTAFNGIVISGSSATVGFAAVTISNAGTGMLLDGNSGSISFGDVAISQPGANGIDVQGVNGTISFQNIDITNLSLTGRGLDLSGSSSTFTATTLDITGTGGTSTGIDLSGTTGGSVTIGSGVISGVGTGVQMGANGTLPSSANTTFSFGGGSITGSVASLDMRGLLAGSGTYAFGATALVGPQLFDTANLIFVGSGNTGAGDGSSVGNLINAAAADDLTTDANTIFVLVKSSAVDVIDTDTDGFTLSNGQSVVSFANGASVDLGAPPANVTGANVVTGATQADPFSHGGATLNNAAGSAINLANGNLIQNLTVSNGGSGAAIDGTSISGLNVAGVTIASAVTGIDLTSAAGAIGINNLVIQSAQTGILLANSAATVTFTGTSTVGGVTGTALSFSNYSGSATFADFNIIGAATGINIAGGSTGTLNFDAASSIANTSGIAFNIDTATPNLTYNGTINQTSAATAVRINAMTGGSATFGGAITASTGIANAIDLTNNAGGTINFAGVLDLTTDGGFGFRAINGGTVSVTAAGNTIGTGAGATERGIQLGGASGLTIGAAGINFASVTVDGSGGFVPTGILIENTSGGNVTFGAVNISRADGDAIRLTNVQSGTYTFGGTTTLATVGGTGPGFAVQGSAATINVTNLVTSNVAGADVSLTNNTGTISIGGTITNGGSGDGVVVSGGSAAITVSATISSSAVLGGNAVKIDGITGGSVAFTSPVTSTSFGNLLAVGTTTVPTGGTISFSGSELTASSGGTVTIAGLGAGATFNATAPLSITNTTGTGLSVTNVAGNATFGAVTVSDAATGIGLANNTGTVAFGATSVTNVNLGQTGVSVSGTNAGTVSFASLGIAMTGNGATGISFANAVMNGTFTATDFDLTSDSSLGTTAVDLSSTTGTGSIQLGDAGAPGNTTAATIGGSGNGPAVGFQFTSTTAVNFIYGDGEGTVDKPSTVKAVDIMASTGAFPVAGTYNFKDVDGANGGFVGDISEAQGPTVYYVDQNGTGNGTAANPGSIEGAEASGADVIVFIDTSVNGTSDFIDMMQAQQVGLGNNTFNLANGQVLIGLKAGESIDTAPLGAVGGGLGNAFSFSGISSSTIIDAPAGIDTVLPTLSTANGNTISFAGKASIDNVIIANTFASGIGIQGADITKLILSRATISGGGGGALSLTDGVANGEIALSDLILSATGGNIGAVDGSVGAGVLKVSAFSDITLLGNNGEVGGFILGGVVFDANAATAGIDQVDGGAFIAGTAANRVGGFGLLLDDTISGNLKFDTTNIAVQQASNVIFLGNVALGIYANPIDGSGSILDFGAATIDVAGSGTAGSFFNGAYLLVNSTNKIGFSSATSFTGTNGVGGISANRAAATGGELFFASASNTFNVNGPALDVSNVALTNGAGGSAQFGTINVTGGQNGIKLLNLIASPTIQFNGPVTIANTTVNAIQLDNVANGVSVTFAGAVGITNASQGGVKWQRTAGSTDTLTFAGGLDIQNNGGVGFNAAYGNVVLSGAATRSIATTNGRGLVVNGANFSNGAAGAAEFNNVSASGYLSGGGIDINAGSGAVRFAGTVNLSPDAATVGTAFGISIGGGTTGTYTFAGTTTITGGNDDNGVYIRNTGASLTVDFTGPLNVTTGMNAVDLNDTTGNLAFSIQHASSSLTTTTVAGTAFLAVGGNGTIGSAASISSVGLGASITGRSGGTVTLSGNITQALRGVEVNGGTGGSVVFSGTQKTLNTGTTNAVRVFSPTSVSFINGGLEIDTTTGTGISINGTGGTASVTVSGAGNTVNTGSGTGVAITGGVGAVAVDINAAVTSTTGLAANVQGVTSGTVTLSGNLNAAGIVVNANTGGTIDFSGATKTLSSGAATAVNLTNNTGATVNFSNGGLAITTTSGTGFNASGGGVVSVGTGGNTNTIVTTTGTALSLNGVSVGAAGLNFATVSTNGAATGISLTDVGASGGGTIALGAINLQGITSRGVDVSGTLGAVLSFNDLDIGLNSSSAVAFDLAGATINAAVTANDFDVTNSAAAGTSIGVDLRGATGGQTVRLGVPVAGGSSSSIVGVNTGIYLSSTTNLAFTYGDGESATDQLSTISATIAIDASSAPVAGSYNFQDVNFQASPGLGFGIGKVYFVDSDGATGGGNGSGTDGANPMTLAAAEALATVNDIIVLINNGNVITAAGTNTDNTLNLAAGTQVRGFGNGAINLAMTVPSTIQLASNSISIAAIGSGGATLTSSAGSNVITLGASGNIIDGFILDGSPAGAARGIKDNGGGASGTSVTNMTIRNFLTAGIEITPSASTTIDNVIFSGNGSDAILNASNTTISNVTSAGATGIAFDIRNASGTTTLSNISIIGAVGGGISFGGASGPAGTITGTNVDIGGANAIAVTGGNAAISFDAASSIANTSGTAVTIANRTGGSFSFSGSVVANGAASGISVSGATAASSVSFTGTVDLGTTTAMTGTAVSINNNGQASTISFANLDIVSSGTTGFSVSNGGTVNVTTGTINATSAQALLLNGVAATATFTSVNSTGGTNNVALTSVTGTVNLGSGALSGASGAAFLVSGGSANVNYAGTIAKTTAGNVVSIASRTGGTLTLSGNLSATGGVANGISVSSNSGGAINFSGSTKTLTTGANTAVSLASNTGTNINFTGGGLAISTTSGAGFSATGGGTVSVQGSNNTIVSTTGTALTVTSTTIGANDMTFRSISSNGAANGIVLNTTGALGGLTVTGDGSSSNNGSGGTIQNSTGDGISLNNTAQARLARMNITNNLGSGIGGSTINGLLIERFNISGNGNDASTDESGINIYELTGTPFGGANETGIIDSVISNNHEFEIQITNTAGTLSDFRLTNNTISSNGPVGGAHGNLVNFLGLGTANMTLNASGGSYTGAAPDTATGLHIDHSGTGGLMTANVNGGTFTNNNVAVTVSSANGGNLDFDINGVTATGNRAHGLNLFVAASSTGTVTGTFRNNIIGTAGVTGSGADLGFGIRVQNEGSATTANAVTVLIENNTIRELANFAAINVNQGIAAQAFTRTQNVTVRNNIISDVDNSRGIIIQQNNTTAPGIMNATIHGNSFANVAGNVGDGTEIRLRQLAGGTFNLVQLSAADLATVNGLTLADLSIGGTITYGAAPPPLP